MVNLLMHIKLVFVANNSDFVIAKEEERKSIQLKTTGSKVFEGGCCGALCSLLSS